MRLGVSKRNLMPREAKKAKIKIAAVYPEFFSMLFLFIKITILIVNHITENVKLEREIFAAS